MQRCVDLYYNFRPFFQLTFATFIGALIGLERELRSKPAGIRTFSILCLTSCLLAIVSISVPGLHDTSRTIAQVVAGIGFLCGGVIWKKDNNIIEGLTTAASLFCVSAIGICIGCNLEILAVFSTIAVFIIMELFGLVYTKINKYFRKEGR